MAGCYHDTQDFKSDLNIEVAREGDILEAGQDLKDIKCTKNPGHRGFIPFKDLTLEHLPIERRTRETLDNIKKIGSNVVRLVVDKIKRGSGYVFKFDKQYFIGTNNHVIGTEDAVKKCIIEFHYDSLDRSSVLTSRGVKLGTTCPYRDVTIFSFHPVPDFLYQLDWMDEGHYIPNIVIMYKHNRIVADYTILIPKFEFYSFHDLNCSLIRFMCLSWPNGSISYIKSCYFKFQPIPSNIQMLTSIAIHIVEDDGKSRVLPGDVVKFGDEFVVKISEYIFQDEVKKCRLVRNGKVIGRGTRLYFQQVKSSDIFSENDLEIQMKQGKENYWLFDFHPKPRSVEAMTHKKPTRNMCCISHPHGGIKMVTFGLYLEESIQRFDNRYRRITEPNTDCQCKNVSCVTYTCKTCPGSSGSPVIPLFEVNDMSISFTHFMGTNVKRFLSNGELVDNINIAWIPT